jgi:hypothetical protein
MDLHIVRLRMQIRKKTIHVIKSFFTFLFVRVLKIAVLSRVRMGDSTSF